MTIQQSGNKESSLSNFLTYSYLLFAIVVTSRAYLQTAFIPLVFLKQGQLVDSSLQPLNITTSANDLQPSLVYICASMTNINYIGNFQEAILNYLSFCRASQNYTSNVLVFIIVGLFLLALSMVESAIVSTQGPPPYGQRLGKFLPRKVDDYGDGGAYPEIHIQQFPLNMGREGAQKTGKTLSLTVGEDGKVSYDAIMRYGRNPNEVVYTKHKDLVPKVDLLLQDEDEGQPDEEELENVRKETENALNQIVTKRLGNAQPTSLPKQPQGPQYIKYTPTQTGQKYNSGAKARVIQMHEMPVDPLEPPKFRHKKVPRASGDPPVPVQHSPPRPLTKQDHEDWKIPPCISNWKNPKGYTIPLDKRLAADGRGLQDVQINDRFAQLAEALYAADWTARQEIETFNRMQRELQLREKEKREKELRELAAKARMERLGGQRGAATQQSDNQPAKPLNDVQQRPSSPVREKNSRRDVYNDEYADSQYQQPQRKEEDDDEEGQFERKQRLKRDEIRADRKRERDRERRLEQKEAHGFKRSKLTRDRERDISEKIALGQARVDTGLQYDSRLFNQEAGLSSGFMGEDAYNVYDKPLFQDKQNLLKPNTRADADVYGDAGVGHSGVKTDKFIADRGFKGVEDGDARTGGAVQFEKPDAEDPFGLESLLRDVRGKQ
eukprot:TRINITY_DN10245_c0_g3_i1.p1 TRINITY_DN10245_c0_g3~~TRINITY_DN10245_c0_g3_i1.p1  ORF type:complete len:665 (-),score=68.37 TRINITY_DN10245_c0_g3_i1:202-2196(-)